MEIVDFFIEDGWCENIAKEVSDIFAEYSAVVPLKSRIRNYAFDKFPLGMKKHYYEDIMKTLEAWIKDYNSQYSSKIRKKHCKKIN